MLDANTRTRVEDERFNCLCAQRLHVRALEKLNNKILAVDALALIVPVVYFPIRYLTKGTRYEFPIGAIWEILAACLIGVTIWKFVAGWQERFRNHGRLLGENVALVRQAIDLLADPSATAESAGPFLALAGKSEQEDLELLRRPKASERQYAYREALKELGGTTATCPVCRSSPWRFIQGSCDACGNSPKTQN